MKIDQLKLVNFRNYDQLEINFNDHMNIFYGINGSGKTNLVEAVYILALTKSFRINNDKILIKKDNIKAKIQGIINKKEDSSEYSVIISNDTKDVYINDSKVDKLGNYVSKINVVLFNPVDIRLIDEAPEKRRKLLNISIGSLYKEYLIILANYQKILKQRNFYLRGMYTNHNYDTAYLDILTNKLIEYGLLICKYRNDFINSINNYITDIYGSIFNNNTLKIKYISSYKNKTKEEILEMYKKNYQREMNIGKTLYGIHHDDIEFIVDNNSLKEFGSEGQRKNAIISYKLAEINVIKDIRGYYPILILDDLFSELDKGRVLNIFNLLNNDVQIFITTTEIKNIKKKYIKDAKIFHVENGTIMEVKNE